MNISRIVFLTQNGVFVKVGRHNTDGSKLVLKSNSAEAPAELCKSFGIEAGEQWGGSVHAAIMSVDKAAFLAGLAGISEALKAELPQAKALAAPGVCPECGGEDGKHWGFCANHMENKQVN